MTNENELNVGDVVNRLSEMEARDFDRDYICDAIDLIESQQSHIELLESSIREHENVNCELAKLSDDDRMNERNSAKYLKAYYAMFGLIKPNGE